MEVFDVVVVGAGPGGYPAAIRAAQLGASVAIVEKEKLGGTCLNWGCIPTKTLIAAAETFTRIHEAEAFGIEVKGASINYTAMAAHKNKVVAQLQGGIKQLLTANGVKQFTGTASFKDRNTIVVSDGNVIGAKKVIIATGSTSAVPGFLPRHARIVESRGFLDLDKLPASLIVLGGGYIGCELACMAAALGVKVTVVELLDDILILADADVRREVRNHMEKKLGIRVLTGKALEDVRADSTGVSGKVGVETIEAEMLLCSVGRKPVTDGLNIEAAGLMLSDKGFIEADEYCRTKVATIYAIGDVTGKLQLAHFATSQAIIAAQNAVGVRPQKHETLVPSVIFTSPEIGAVGLCEDEARKSGRAIKTGKFRFAALGKAMAAGETAGFVKWVVDAETDRLIGATVVGAHATELIATATSAIRSELTAADFGRTILAHPTFGEALMEASHAVHGVGIHAPPTRKSAGK
jgi:dihydrolipoamide dehydrogenase